MFKTLFKWLKLAFMWLWLLAMILLGAWIFFENQALVSIDYLVIEIENQALGFVICQMLFLGGLLGFLTCFFTINARAAWYKRRYKRSQLALEKLQNAQPKQA